MIFALDEGDEARQAFALEDEISVRLAERHHDNCLIRAGPGEGLRQAMRDGIDDVFWDGGS